jgi:GLPGLI family protein
MKYLFLFFYLLCANTALTQTGRYEYHLIDGMHDTTRRVKEVHTQYFTATESTDTLVRFENVSFHNMIGLKKVMMNPYSVISGKEPIIYKNLSVRRYKQRDFLKFLFAVVIIEDSLPAFEWTLKNETKQIGGYNCLRAETDINGRHFVVWYTPDIPISGGPWKFHGLPGFILEGEDIKQRVSIKFAAITLPFSQPVRIAPFPAEETMTFTAFKSYYDEQARKIVKLRTGNEATPIPVPSGTTFTFSVETYLHRIDFDYSLRY